VTAIRTALVLIATLSGALLIGCSSTPRPWTPQQSVSNYTTIADNYDAAITASATADPTTLPLQNQTTFAGHREAACTRYMLALAHGAWPRTDGIRAAALTLASNVNPECIAYDLLRRAKTSANFNAHYPAIPGLDTNISRATTTLDTKLGIRPTQSPLAAGAAVLHRA
jgi:hypothetical protein